MRYILIFLSVMSLSFVWSLNPLDARGSWVLQAFTPPKLLAPDIPSGFQEVIANIGGNEHLLVSVISFLMIITGIIIAYRKFGRSSGDSIVALKSEPPSGWVGNISFNNWYLDRFYSFMVIRPVLQIAEWSVKADQKWIDGLIHMIGTGYVIISHIIAWFDRTFIDGFVNMLAGLSRYLGRMTAGLTKGNVQYFILIALLGIIILIWFVT